MSLEWKIDVLQALKDKGYSSYRLRKDRIFGERVVQQLRDGDPVSWEVLSRLCDLLQCDIGSILRAVPRGSDNAGQDQASGSASVPGVPQGFFGAAGAGGVTSENSRE